MANKQLALSGTRLFNNSNAVASGGTAELYLSGTLTPQNFLDENGTSLGSSLTANGLGQLPVAYQDENTAFRLILKDRHGTELDGGDIDPFYFGRDNAAITLAAGASVSTRALLAAIDLPANKQSAILTESGRGGNFVFSTNDLSAQVAADTLQGVYVAPASDTTGASGAWVRRFTGPLQVEWFGGDNAGFAAMLSLATTLDIPAAVTNQSVLLTAQQSLPAGVTLVIDGGEVYATDTTLESIIKVAAANVTLEGRNGGRIRGQLTSGAGLTGVCLLARGSSGFRCKGIHTQDGKHGILTLENDDMVIEDAVVNNSLRWGVTSGGNRNFTFRDCRVDTTRDTDTCDCFKVFGAGNGGWSTRSSYKGAFINCEGVNVTGIGQAFDVISDTDAADDLYDITFINIVGRDCTGGLLELKVTSNVTTNMTMHSIRIQGGWFNNGLDPNASGVKVAERIYDIEVNDVVVEDVTQGFYTSGVCQQVRFNNCTAIRPRQNGYLLNASQSAVGNQVNNPTVIDANYGQAASTYSGIKVADGDSVLITNPTVMCSQTPPTFKHTYGIEILAAASKVVLSGAISLKDHVTGPISNATTGCIFPTTLTVPTTSISSSASAVNTAGDATQGTAFVACAYTVLYTAASNVARTVTLNLRNASTSTSLFNFTSSATAAIYDTTQGVIAAPVRVAGSQPTLQMNQAAVTLPGSPVGSILVKVHGYYDAAAL